MAEFTYTNFLPRDVFRKKADQWLEDILDQFPSDSYCEAKASKGDSSFQFSVLIRSSEGTFEGETKLTCTIGDTADRDWQMKAIKQLDNI